MSWQPIETAPPNTDILTYADWDETPISVSTYTKHEEGAEEEEQVSVNAKGRRRVIQEFTVERRTWSGTHWEPTHWQPLPAPPTTEEKQ